MVGRKFSWFFVFFHPEKWKILIGWDKEFANQDRCKYDYNNRGRDYAGTLESYINNDAHAVTMKMATEFISIMLKYRKRNNI